jgi:galactokinase
MNANIASEFERQFHASASYLVRAPGRVNIIGEHTDYNEGFVLPMAIDRAVHIALRPRSDRRVILHSLEYGETVEFPLDELQRGKGWMEYVKGAAWAMQVEGWNLSGWEGLMTGDVPRGAGLSSSSAVVIAAIQAFAAASDSCPDPVKIALLGHHAEDGWIGVHVGIMDQMASVLSQPGHVLFLDCRTLEFQHISLPEGMTVAVMDTSTRRGLVDSAYNERRRQCDAAAKALGVRTLRDVDEEEFRSRADRLDEVTRRRARHVITENGRVLQAVEAMRQGDAETLGRLLDASHASLRDDFEVSNKALDALVAIAQHQPGCYGARMTGAGFGGCAVALVENDRCPEFANAVTTEYHRATSLTPEIYLCQAVQGASLTRLTL